METLNTLLIGLIPCLPFMTFFLANFTIIWWFRKESREDWKLIHQETKEFREAVRLEMKDFHERLLKIEMSRK